MRSSIIWMNAQKIADAVDTPLSDEAFLKIKADLTAKFDLLKAGGDLDIGGTESAVPEIVRQPDAQTVKSSEKAVFTIEATAKDQGSLTYQWQIKATDTAEWTDISGATQTSYEMTAQKQDNGAKFRCVVTNTKGELTPATATSGCTGSS